MTTTSSDLPPFEPRQILEAPFSERVRLVCQTWAAQVNPNPIAVLALYWVKYLLVFVGGWAFFVSFSANYPGFLAVGSWAFTSVAFQKAIAWAIVYESVGLGCSFGPMNGRISPPLGGLLHFLRPGTIKLPLFPGIPILGSTRRSWLDVGLYALNLLFLFRALLAPEVTPELLLPSFILLPLLGITDKTLFLAARGEHYFVALVCLVVASGDDLWISGCKILWCGIWFWAATSKLNHHFPSVIMFMMNNGPFLPRWLKRKLFVSYPADLRPSTLATAAARMGMLTEFMIPVVLLLGSESAVITTLALIVMTGFHSFIAVNNPSGMPIEWNILMVYGGIFLFGFHPEASVLALYSMPLLAVFLFICLVVVPGIGNFFPARVSFLFAMRYYAGNWAYNIWLFRGESWKKLGKLKKAAGTLREQFEAVLPDAETVEVTLAMSMAHRFMHLEGRPLLHALPRAVDRIEDYEWMDGEVLGGIVLGWNFGDGHLNHTQLLDAIQEQCQFEAGELRVVAVESQPLFGRHMQWRVVDAKTGLVEQGATEIEPLRNRPPWPTEALAPGLQAPTREG